MPDALYPILLGSPTPPTDASVGLFCNPSFYTLIPPSNQVIAKLRTSEEQTPSMLPSLPVIS